VSIAESDTPRPELGWIAREVQDEFSELRLICLPVASDLARVDAKAIERHLRGLSNRFTGARAVNLRREPVPAAYRIFFRHIGLDPDVTQTPIEAAILERLMDGGFLPRSPLEDLLLSALVETSVPVWALDAERIDGPLGIRLSQSESLGRGKGAKALSAGQLVVADAAGALAVLFGPVAAGHVANAKSTNMVLFTIQVSGVPALQIEEALWMCTSALASV
jgi:DNA/RNA-binding domain of Phe-tRNA-synthetase-like protein